MRLTKKFKTFSPKGLGVKACLDLRRLARQCNCKLIFRVDDKMYSLKSLVGAFLLMMAEGEELEIVAQGKGAEAAIARLGGFYAFKPQ